jgi:hypothetical protein
MGKQRRVDVRSPSFVTVPALLEGTTRLAIMHERLARTMARNFPIAMRPMPFPIPPLREIIQHHRARAFDEGLIWFRQRICEFVSI